MGNFRRAVVEEMFSQDQEESCNVLSLRLTNPRSSAL
jgi:hypothetical protein